MAGLLAWAADVVTGNGNAPQQEEVRSPSSRIRFSVQQQDEVRQLDDRAAALQHTIQHLRQRIPPPDISRSLPQLHADSLAAHSALTLELNAHQDTQKEAQIRKASLQAENAAYAKAITSVEQQVQRKAQERNQLEARLQETGREESILRNELDHLQSPFAEKEGTSQSVLEDKEKAVLSFMSTSNKALMEGEELQRTRAELKLWEDKLATLEQEWAVLLQNSTRWPSAAQREKELERRLRSLSEQLVTKQAQADAWTKERNALELQLSEANEIHRQLLLGNAGTDVKRTKRKIFGLSSSGSASVFMTEESKVHSQFAIVAVLQRTLEKISDTFRNVGGINEKWNRQTGTQICTATALRAFVAAYVLSLHMIAFAVISFAG